MGNKYVIYVVFLTDLNANEIPVNLSQFRDAEGVFSNQLNLIKQLNIFKNFLNQHVKLVITRDICTTTTVFFLYSH